MQELLKSIEVQDFPKSEMEVLVITEGTSESAKAIGIRLAKGEVIGILASDNELFHKTDLTSYYEGALNYGVCIPGYYHWSKEDDSLNRYFALIGGNDPLSYYMGKNDKLPYFDIDYSFPFGSSLGDNGYFVKKELIESTDLDNYYHVDNANEVSCIGKRYPGMRIWHKTGGNIFSFFRKRYHYGLQHAFNKNRRWHLVDFSKQQDIRRFLWFIFASLTLVHPLYTSIRGYSKIGDLALFLHPLICLATLFTYGCLVIHLCVRGMFQSLFAPMVAQRA